MAQSLVGYILAKNEESVIEDAVRSLRRVTDEVVVVDAESADATRQRAAAAGAVVWVRSFDSFAGQRNWALDEIERRLLPEWIFCLDADETLSDDLVAELRGLFNGDAMDADVYMVRRMVQFDGRLLRRGGFTVWVARLQRAGLARYEARLVNEHLAVPAGARIARLGGAIEHSDIRSWERHIDKHNRYSSLEARERRRSALGATGVRLGEAVRRPDLRRRWLREQIWRRVPARPAVRFVHVYVMRGGVLDGRAGFRRALFEAWQEMCIDLKAEALEAGRQL